MAPFKSFCTVFNLKFYSNDRIFYHNVRYTAAKNNVTLKTGLGLSKVSPFDRPYYTTCYRSAIVAPLSSFELFGGE